MAIDKRTEQDRINTPADSFGTNLSSDFKREDAPLSEASDRADHRSTATNGRADNEEPSPEKLRQVDNYSS
jgi:hypothetical protein